MPIKRTVKNKTPKIKETELISPMESTEEEMKQPMVSRKMMIAGAIVVVIAILLFVFKSLFVVALVNNQPVWRLTLIQELEKQGGKKVLDSLVTQDLILQEGQKQKVTVTDKEIDDSIKQIETNVTQQGSKLDDLLAAQGLTRSDLRDQVKIQKIAEKILSKDVKVTDQQIKDYYDKNQSTLPTGKTLDDLKAQIKSQLEQQQLNDKISAWVDGLHSKAKINYFIKY